MKKRFLALALASALTLGLLAGCGDKPAAGGDKPAGSSAPGGTAAAGGEVVIGLLANTTGADAQYGNAVRNGAMLYINEVNAAGGVNGKTIKVIEYDDKGDATEAVTNFNRMVSEGITALIGSVLTAPTIAVADESFAINMPQISASATAAGVTVLDPAKPEDGIRTNMFRSCFIDPFQGQKMADYAADKLGAKTAAVIFKTGEDYSTGLAKAFVEECAAKGITVTTQEGYAAGDKDFKAQLTRIAGGNPDVIFAPNYYEDVGMIVTQARQIGITSTFLGGDGWGGVKDYASAADLEGAVYCSGYAPASNDTVKKFEADYEAAYKAEVPSMFAPLGYDAAKLMVAAITAAEDKGLATGSDEYKQAVIDAMKATDGLEGITGAYKFDEYNNPIKSAAMIALKSGEEVFTELF